ncbi:MAG: methyl-accepting chemotaxis protein [Pseudomonadota bacterium]
MSFAKAPLTRIVWLIAGVGLSLGLLFASYNVWVSANSLARAKDSAELLDFAVALSDLVHEQQKERGASAVFLTNAGQAFEPEMRAQRRATDVRRDALAQRLEQIRTSGAATRVEEQLVTIESRLSEIDAMRRRVDDLSVTRGEQVQFYTGLNHTAIGFVGEISAGVSEPEVAQGLLVYSALMFGKDVTGIDRAIGASGFSQGSFDGGLDQRLVGLLSAQTSYLDFVSRLVSDEQRGSLDAILRSDVAQRITAMREVALSGDSAAIAQYSGSDWFDAQTEKIGSLKVYEDAMAAQLSDQINVTVAHAQSVLIVAGVILIIAFSLAWIVCFYFVRTINMRIASVIEPLHQLSQGVEEVSITDQRGNEFEPLVDVMKSFRQSIVERKQLQKDRELIIVTLRNRLKAMASGDLSSQIDQFFSDEFKSIRMDFNETQRVLSEVIDSVVASASQIDHSADDVMQAANDLSERTSHQAATLEEAASALQDTTVGIQTSAQKADETNSAASKARENAAQNGQLVEVAMEAMDQIRSSFTEVEQITKMIQDIAFQTNILALNAGVEATRAGEAGKGFGVVASEVRALAQRSSEAVTAIQDLMGSSAQSIEHGYEQVSASASALRTMIEMIDTISDNVSELADASVRHAQGLAEVNGSVANLDKATQQNAAMAEQSSAASAQLAEQVRALRLATAIFTRKQPSDGEGAPVDLSLSA